MKNLEPIYYGAGTTLHEAQESINTMHFIQKGGIKIMSEINGQNFAFLKMKNNIQIGLLNIAYNQRA